jgi:hypothetical protein
LKLQIHVSILEMGFWNGSKLWILTIASSCHGSYIIYHGRNNASHIGLGHGNICVSPMNSWRHLHPIAFDMFFVCFV